MFPWMKSKSNSISSYHQSACFSQLASLLDSASNDTWNWSNTAANNNINDNIYLFPISVFCPEGTEEYPPVSGSCRKCPDGFYRTNSLLDRFVNCTECPDGFTTSSDGSTSVDECQLCKFLYRALEIKMKISTSNWSLGPIWNILCIMILTLYSYDVPIWHH